MQVPDRTARRGHAAFAGWFSSAPRCCPLRSETAVTRRQPGALRDDQPAAIPWPPRARILLSSLRSAPRPSFAVAAGARLPSALSSACCQVGAGHTSLPCPLSGPARRRDGVGDLRGGGQGRQRRHVLAQLTGGDHGEPRLTEAFGGQQTHCHGNQGARRPDLVASGPLDPPHCRCRIVDSVTSLRALPAVWSRS
jgi:hypothetical protein